MSAANRPASGFVKFPGSKMAAVAFAAALLGGVTAWIGAREQLSASIQEAAPQPASAPVETPQRLGPNGGLARTGRAPASSRPKPATRTRAS